MSALDYLVAEPLDRTADAPPLLCFLHGYDEAAPLTIETALTRHGPLSRSASTLARQHFAIVAPQLPRAGDIWHRYAADVEEIVRRMGASLGADPARTYLTGFSFGGNAVFDLALRGRGLWAALWAVDPTRVPARDPGLPTWVSVGQAARAHARRFVSALGLRPATPAGDALGDGDRIYLDEGLDHTGSAARAYADDRVYGWLLARAGAPA